ncbi:polygalacturonase [Thecamonas trahens ATCC 50062]|uniref:Polygalacturonase n=1 Tax=Thecamonas trahens ATCC 50062 TaxID=461836 RepID=A0A0L0D5H1_THETB|nr:polygalacturonase [Thecamonas trahens ATCC 50062]KNC47336.1 polygalacturonase [Thecamonas trahens ATCC 50062]|eukprot:XP_013759674.1 polygalacturonase [Thecamonas trahens ATCC 50062]
MQMFLVVATVLLAVVVSGTGQRCASTPAHAVCSVVAFGARGDGKTDDTGPIQEALACAACDVVVLPFGGVFVARGVNLSSNTELRVETGAVLMGAASVAGWPLVDALPSYPLSRDHNSQPRYQALIAGYDVVNVSISGGGRIDGRGEMWWRAVRKHELSMQRPPLIEIVGGVGVRITELELKDSPYYHIHPYMCRGVVVDRVRIDAPLGSPNTDGIDPDSSSDVRITRCTISSGDDHISLKAGKGWEGYAWGVPTERVLIADNIFHHGAGIAIGSETGGGIADVVVSNATLDASQSAVRFKTCPTYGRGMTNVTYDGVVGIGLLDGLFVDMAYECGAANASLPAPIFASVTLRNLQLDGIGRAGAITCLPSGCRNWRLADVHVASIEGWTVTPGGMLVSRYRKYGREEEAQLAVQREESMRRLAEAKAARAQVEEMKGAMVAQFTAMGREMETVTERMKVEERRLEEGIDSVFAAARSSARAHAIRQAVDELDAKERELLGQPPTAPPVTPPTSTDGAGADAAASATVSGKGDLRGRRG